jgi:two-component system sensor histidine kinase EvgS
VVIADCNMPVMNGYDLTRAIRRHEQEQHMPRSAVLGFTANAQSEEKQRCMDAGMDDCLFKPIGLTSLSERLSGIAPQQTAPPSPGYSLDSVRNLTGDRPELIQRLLAQLISSNREDREALAELIVSDDRGGLREIAHKIRGAARIIRASAVIEACEALERACNDHASISELKACQQAVERALVELEQALQLQQTDTHQP